ncbi:MAG TPA: polyketide synthase, partial [Kofleriaceae bacterium]
LDAFWTELRAGRCAITEVPAGRWRADLLYRPQLEAGKTISKWGGFLDAIEDFDPGYFAMTDEEATCLDPAVRLMLEGIEACLADAGYTAPEVGGRAVGVFAGARVSDYWRRTGSRTGSAGFGADQNFIAARIAHHLDLGGPCFVVDSACSSSLVAVQLAARSLLAGESELAFAAGVEVLLDERPYLEFSAARALSPSGRCRVFDERADGFVPGEGCGVVLLKRLDRALRDGDRIRAVIEAVAVNNDGRTVGLTTPNPAAQTAVILRALEQAGRTARDIALIEAHGTGTMLGDPIELRALTDAFASHALLPGSCAIGSVKSNLGHLLSAAGIAGLLKGMLSLERGEIPPTLFCERPNPRFEFARSPFYPVVGLQRWPDDRPRVAGVSAFGLGGTNAHLILAAHEPASHAVPVRHPLAPPQLRRRRLWLDREPVIARPEIAPHPLIASILDLQFDGAS